VPYPDARQDLVGKDGHRYHHRHCTIYLCRRRWTRERKQPSSARVNARSIQARKVFSSNSFVSTLAKTTAPTKIFLRNSSCYVRRAATVRARASLRCFCALS
jgi:hypothetical protein